jgi:hypothetical protein
VVAIFPRFFEQIAEWLNEKPMTGALDIGSAGFRGFADASDPKGRIRNLMYVSGQHGAAIEFENQRKLAAIANYAVKGEDKEFAVFEDASDVAPWPDIVSNVSWAVWLLLIGALVAIGYTLARRGWGHAAAYIVGVLLLLNSV